MPKPSTSCLSLSLPHTLRFPITTSWQVYRLYREFDHCSLPPSFLTRLLQYSFTCSPVFTLASLWSPLLRKARASYHSVSQVISLLCLKPPKWLSLEKDKSQDLYMASAVLYHPSLSCSGFLFTLHCFSSPRNTSGKVLPQHLQWLFYQAFPSDVHEYFLHLLSSLHKGHPILHWPHHRRQPFLQSLFPPCFLHTLFHFNATYHIYIWIFVSSLQIFSKI